MSAVRSLILLIFGFTMLKFICCYSDGSVLTDQCQSMAIIHDPYQPQGQASNPFTVDPDNVIVDGSQVGRGITVTLSASSGPFMGFMLEARACDDCPPAGTFSLLDSVRSLLLCSDQAVAHSDITDKYLVQVTWTPQATGQFFFRAAFVQNFVSFWTKKAIILLATTTSPPTTMAMTTTLMTTTPQTTQTTMQTTMQTMTQTTTQTTTTSPTPTTLKKMMTTATTTSTDTTATVTTRRTTLGLTKLPLQQKRRPKGPKYMKEPDHRDKGNRGSRERQLDESD